MAAAQSTSNAPQSYGWQIAFGAAGAATLGLLAAVPAKAAPTVGEPAPAFTGTTAEGETVSLDDYAGKTVILEWTNDGCPYVRKHYDSGNMQALQREAKQDDIVWLTVISSAPGKQGYATGPQAISIAEEAGAMPGEIVLDPSGEIGHAYDARTTPHMYIVDAQGTLRYMGGIDDRPTADKADIDGATNYVSAALDDMQAGREVARANTPPYGCSIKYGS